MHWNISSTRTRDYDEVTAILDTYKIVEFFQFAVSWVLECTQSLDLVSMKNAVKASERHRTSWDVTAALWQFLWFDPKSVDHWRAIPDPDSRKKQISFKCNANQFEIKLYTEMDKSRKTKELATATTIAAQKALILISLWLQSRSGVLKAVFCAISDAHVNRLITQLGHRQPILVQLLAHELVQLLVQCL